LRADEKKGALGAALVEEEEDSFREGWFFFFVVAGVDGERVPFCRQHALLRRGPLRRADELELLGGDRNLRAVRLAPAKDDCDGCHERLQSRNSNNID